MSAVKSFLEVPHPYSFATSVLAPFSIHVYLHSALTSTREVGLLFILSSSMQTTSGFNVCMHGNNPVVTCSGGPLDPCTRLFLSYLQPFWSSSALTGFLPDMTLYCYAPYRVLLVQSLLQEQGGQMVSGVWQGCMPSVLQWNDDDTA